MLSEEFLDIILIQNIQVVNWFLERDPSASSGGASLRVCQIKNKCVTASDFQFLIPSASPTAIWWALYLCNLKLVALSTYLFFIRALSQETSALNPLLVTSLAVYKGALYKSHHFFWYSDLDMSHLWSDLFELLFWQVLRVRWRRGSRRSCWWLQVQRTHNRPRKSACLAQAN